MDVPTNGVAEYIVAGIAENRAKRGRDDNARKAMLQRVQLEDGLIVVDEEGVVEEWVPCPACAEDKPSIEEFQAAYEYMPALAYERVGMIRLEAPYGLEATRRASSAGPKVDASKIPTETLLWALANGALSLKVNNTVLRSFDQETADEYLYHLPLLGAAITPAEESDVLQAASKNTIKKWMAK